MRCPRRFWLLCLLLVVIAVAACACGRTAGSPETSASPATGPATTSSAPASSSNPTTPGTQATQPAVTVFAVLGDYGVDDAHEAAVAHLVASWRPAFIITTGDDYYSSAGGEGTATYDESTGAYYGRWLRDITTTGKRCPAGLASTNAFFPALGNHDYGAAGIDNYLEYFTLPGAGLSSTSGNERYYDYVEGPIHFFVLNSNQEEPDGRDSSSKQALWLKTQLAASTSTWNIVCDHHPPYSSDVAHGSTKIMQWPFAEWGADAVLSGHAHVYERLERDGIAYFVNGLGGADRYVFGKAIEGDRVRYRDDWGAQKVTVTADALIFEFWSAGGKLVDTCRLPAG
jgi:tartrate-resistant acid phosphatase type 5